MSVRAGYSVPLTPAQCYDGDLARLASQIPWAAVQRALDLAVVADVREASVPRPGWASLFAKALAFVAAARPELRQLYLSFPRPCLYEHPTAVVAVAVERPLDDEWPLLWARLRHAEQRGLVEIDAQLRGFEDEPLDRLGQGRHALNRSRL